MGRRSMFRDLLETALLTIAIFLVVRVALQNFKVEGESMEPNFHNGEYILVNKVDYLVRSPQRGDVIVFRAVPAGQPNRDFIKRVVGLPGESVQVKNNTVYINGNPLPEVYPRAPMNYTFGPSKVPPNDYFVLGDNRSNSMDSHMWKWLPKSDIVGRAWITYWPPADMHVFEVAMASLGV